MKQEALAMELGEDWTQKKVSLLEAKEEVEPEILEQVAKVLEGFLQKRLRTLRRRRQ